jgi:DNA invertase Pin-like site-specific DNA recombinase
MQRVIGYVRVSTLEQAENGLSLVAQRQRIEDYCRTYGLELVDTLSDDGLSAKTTAGRPNATRVIEMVGKKQIDGVVFLKLDRIARNTVESIKFAELCRKKGVVLHSITEKIDTSTAMGEFFFTLMAALGQMERRQIGERTREVLRHKRANGEKTGGTVPFGYIAKKHSGKTVLVRDPGEQAVLGLMKSYRGKGHSIRTIVRALEAKGVCTKTGKPVWSPASVLKVLRASGVHVGPKVNSKKPKKVSV